MLTLKLFRKLMKAILQSVGSFKILIQQGTKIIINSTNFSNCLLFT